MNRKILSITLTLCLLLSTFIMSPVAYAAEGDGTEGNPYLITTPAELQKINEDVTAHYKLMADIDLKQALFTPLGNIDTGAFSGSFDGNGHTISNLKIDVGKYAGLFGCNEGMIKNVKIKNADVYGSRYVGGIVGQNMDTGVITACSVESGKIYADTGVSELYVGGICGYNSGKFEGKFYNGAQVDSPNYAGGIVAYSASEISLTADNSGSIKGSTVGGVVGFADCDVDISESSNCGAIIGGYGCAGLIGRAEEKVTISGCYNDGLVKSYNADGRFSAAGLIGNASARRNCIIRNSWNNGDIAGGGLLGNGGGKIYNSYNTGNCEAGIAMIFYNSDISNCFNSGACSKPIAIENRGATVTNFYNTGNWRTWDYYDSDYHNSNGIKSYNAGNSSCDGKVSRDFVSSEKDCFYKKESQTRGKTRLTENEMQDENNFPGWDFENVWEIDPKVNNGMPILRNAKAPLMLNYSVKTLVGNETLQLVAYKDGIECKDVKWSVTAGAAKVSENGFVTTYTDADFVTVSAIDTEGNRVNCNIRHVNANNVIKAEQSFTTSINSGTLNFNTDFYLSWISYSLDGNDFLVEAVSTNPEIVSVEGWTDSQVNISKNAAGTADIILRSAGGAETTCKVTVTNAATQITFDKSTLEVPINETKKLTAETKPIVSSSAVTWKSSDEEIASVDASGNVTGLQIGSATITATTDTGYSANCTINVTAPVKNMAFTQEEITIYKNDTAKLELAVDPVNTTDKITYSSDYTYYATVSENGVVTGKNPGTVKITAKASSGVTATCTVKVIDYPTIVTGVTLDQTKYDMKTGEVFKLNATVVPSNATDRSITLASTDSSVASVSEAGVVSAVGAGKAVITATSGNGVIAACEVTVTGVASTNLSRIYIPEIFDAKSEIINVPVMIEHNPGISFINFSVSYDKEKMEPLEINNGALFESVMGSIDAENGKIKLIFSSDTDITKSGVLAKIKFKRKNMEEDITDLSVSYYPNGVMNKKQKRIALKMSDGRLNAYRSTICGDVDENRKVDFADALYFKRYLANWSKYQDISLKTANLDSDNEITPADLMILERHIAGWTGYQNIPQNQN